MAKSPASNVRVVARIRPLAKYELENGSKETVVSLNSLDDNTSPTDEPQLVQIKNQERWFELDAVFDKASTQEDVYIRSGAKQSVVEDIFKGYNATILAYGQTGAGKTYSMGSADSLTLDENAGMIPRCCFDIFETIQQKCDGNATVELSYLEIYNEELRDLLAPDAKPLKIRENLKGEIYVAGLQKETVTSPLEIGNLMEQASKKRVTASTAMNAVSSRSHALCVIAVKGILENSEKFDSKLTLVDLAGSERIKKTGAQGNRRTEGININKSLLVLGQVVAALSQQHKRNARKPPYRDSKLTRLLQDSLGGNSRTIMVACVSPADFNIDESVNTLRYATSARNIKNTATRNIVKTITPEEAAKLQRQNELLKKEVEELKKTLEHVTTQPRGVTRVSSFVSQTSEEEMDDESVSKVKRLEKEVKELRRELEESKEYFTNSAGKSLIELPEMKREIEQLREEAREAKQLQEENQQLLERLEQAEAEREASQKAASKLTKIMDKLQELKGDELDKKKLQYEHIKKEEKWVAFLSNILSERREEMKKLVDDFHLVVRVVESPIIMNPEKFEGPEPKRRWFQRKEIDPGDPGQIRQQLLTQHVAFFNECMSDITKNIDEESRSLKDIRSGLRRSLDDLEMEIGVNEFEAASLNSGDEDLLRQLTTVLIGPVHKV